jgi:hypothetical protein
VTEATSDIRQEVIAGATQEVDQLERLIQACRNMQDELRVAVALMEEGHAMTTILSRSGSDSVIPQLTEAMEQTNAARRIGRRAMIRLALAEGMTTVQLGERLGISRQLVARYRDE